MNTPDTTLVQQVVLAAAAAGYASGMRGLEYIAIIALCCVALIADAHIRRGRASILEAATIAQSGDDEDDE